MKFPQLPVGQRFVFQGEVYSKVGPVTARRERDGEQRLIARSAAIFPPDEQAAAAAARASAHPWESALDAYERELRKGLGPVDERFLEGLESVFERARAAFAAVLKPTERRLR